MQQTNYQHFGPVCSNNSQVQFPFAQQQQLSDQSNNFIPCTFSSPNLLTFVSSAASFVRSDSSLSNEYNGQIPSSSDVFPISSSYGKSEFSSVSLGQISCNSTVLVGPNSHSSGNCLTNLYGSNASVQITPRTPHTIQYLPTGNPHLAGSQYNVNSRRNFNHFGPSMPTELDNNLQTMCFNQMNNSNNRSVPNMVGYNLGALSNNRSYANPSGSMRANQTSGNSVSNLQLPNWTEVNMVDRTALTDGVGEFGRGSINPSYSNHGKFFYSKSNYI